MLVYPQLTSGALSQFPTMRRRSVRTIVNSMNDGSSVKLGDAGAGTTEWQLSYTGLSDAELAALQELFEAAEGSLNGFTFLDPSANLLAWSEMLTDSVWNAAPLLALQGSVPDAAAGSNGWQLSNTGSGPQALSQTLNAPGGYGYCFSVSVRAVQSTSVTLTVGSNRVTSVVGGTWARIFASGRGDANGTSVVFGIEVPAGAAIDVFGPQVEAQEVPSLYQTSTTGGVYPNARFRDDVLSFTTQDVNRHSATVNIFYANHL